LPSQGRCPSFILIVTHTKRLIIRDYREADFDAFAEMNADPQVVRYFPKPFDRDESRIAFDKIRNRIAESGLGFYALEAKRDGQFVGFTGLSSPEFPADFMPCVEIGWRLRSEYWGQGLATEAARACLDYGWSRFELKEILSFAPVANQPSIGVMKKIGMTFVKHFHHPRLLKCPRLVDCVLYSIQNPLRD
jgi:RimJ/RimL family protein N-acetyltransferase